MCQCPIFLNNDLLFVTYEGIEVDFFHKCIVKLHRIFAKSHFIVR